VGCGRIAGLKDRPRSFGPIATHAQAYHRHPNFHLASVYGYPLQEAQNFGEIWGVPHISPSLTDFIAAGNLDVISICSPNKHHFPQAREILKTSRGVKALFIEKPVCLEPEELVTLISLSREAGVAVAVNHTRRFDPAHQKAAELLCSGDLGDLIRGRAVYYGGWIHNGVHLIDTLRMMLPEEPQVVSAAEAGSGKFEDPDLNVTLAVGQAYIMVERFDEAYYQLFELELLCQYGRLRCLDFGNQIHVERVQVNELGERELKPLAPSPWRGLVSPMGAAVEAIDAQLQGQNVFSSMGVDLSAVQGTMNIIWQAKKMALG
jgi:predicted dehydrogenase